jgi:3-oxoacyl-[acyl-carrier-protein] synthase II
VNSKRRVVVTGLGMISPNGSSVESSWRATIEGVSGVGLIKSFDTTNFSTRICAEPSDFDISLYIPEKEVRKFDMFSHYAVAASDQAMKDSGLDMNRMDPHRAGVAMGSGIGGINVIAGNNERLVEGGPRKVSPFFIPAGIANMAAGQVSIRFGLKGPNICIVTACTTGTHNIGTAARMIAYGDADVMLAGGTERATTPLGVAGFSSLRALSTRNDEPEKASRPWDRDRDGFVLGEGAGALVLEEYEHAKRRGATIYAELVGFGMSADAFHITLPEPTAEGATAAMINALKDAGIAGTDIDYINAHGTSTPAGDEVEALAIRQAFGDYAPKIAISSTKSMIGHLLGAAGAVEAIYSILAIRDNIAPPTINLDNPYEGCDLNLVPHVAQERKIDVSLSNSFGFGGTNGTLIFKRV